LPSIDEQDAILCGLDAELGPITTAITRTEHEITLLREYRTRLIADVVTGKLDVRAAAANLTEEPDDSETVDGDDALADGEDSADADLDAAPEDAEA
jgi:type I restriction enzyme S subunit